MKEIDVAGYRYCDLVLYLAGLLTAMGEKVAVRDMSQESLLFDYIPEVPGLDKCDPLELKGVEFMRGKMEVPEDCSFCFNLWETPEWPCCVEDEKYGEYRLFVTDEEPSHERKLDYSIRYAAGAINEYRAEDSMIVVRDFTGVTMPTYFEMLTGPERNRMFKLPYNEKDRKAELFLSVREDISFKNVSEKMACLLENMIRKLRPQTVSGEFARAYRVVMKGAAR